MPGDVHGEDRAGGGHTIEIRAREMSHLLEHRIVVSKADQPIVPRSLCIDELQGFESLWNGLDRSDRRAVQVRCNGHEPCAREVAVGFDEPGQDRLPLEIELDVGIGQPALHVFVAADRDDSVAFDDERRRLSTVRIHREDVPIGPDLEPRRRRVQTHPRNAAAHDDEKNQGDDRPGDPFDDLLHAAFTFAMLHRRVVERIAV